MKKHLVFICAAFLMLVLTFTLGHKRVHAAISADNGIGTITITNCVSVNIRNSSNADAAIIARAKPGEVFLCISVAESMWYEIMLDIDKVGFIPARMARFDKLAGNGEPDNINIGQLQSWSKDSLFVLPAPEFYTQDTTQISQNSTPASSHGGLYLTSAGYGYSDSTPFSPFTNPPKTDTGLKVDCCEVPVDCSCYHFKGKCNCPSSCPGRGFK